MLVLMTHSTYTHIHNVYHYNYKKAIMYTKLSTYESKSFNYFRMPIKSFDDLPSVLCRENSCTINDGCVFVVSTRLLLERHWLSIKRSLKVKRTLTRKRFMDVPCSLNGYNDRY